MVMAHFTVYYSQYLHYTIFHDNSCASYQSWNNSILLADVTGLDNTGELFSSSSRDGKVWTVSCAGRCDGVKDGSRNRSSQRHSAQNHGICYTLLNRYCEIQFQWDVEDFFFLDPLHIEWVRSDQIKSDEIRSNRMRSYGIWHDMMRYHDMWSDYIG